MLKYYLMIIASGVFAIVYGLVFAVIIARSPAGNDKMKEIALAIYQGAIAYLRRQYTAIAIVGVIIAICLQIFLSWQCTVGFVIGAVLSSVAGFLGMHISIRANVRTAYAAHSDLA